MIRKFSINTIKSLFLIGILGSMTLYWTSCEMDDGVSVEFSEMGAVNAAPVVEAEGGSVEINIYTNHKCRAYPAENYDWIKLMTDEINGDGSFTINCAPNESFRRMAKIYFVSLDNNRLDSIFIKQKGMVEVIMESSTPNMKVMSAAAPVSIPFTTNVSPEDIQISIFGETEANPSWVNHDFVVNTDNNTLDFTITSNTSETELRNARIILNFTDDWGSLYTCNLFLIQANSNDEFGTPITFEQARNWAGEKITSYEYIEGYVISDAGNGNMGDNPQTTNTVIDYTINRRTAYIQSADGKYGFMIVTKSPEDNVFTRYSKVQLLLKDAEVVKDENPSRYTIRNVTSAMILSSEAGDYNSIPLKEKYMSQLTDDDIYTYVTLKDCEFPVRKGSFTPINEGYSDLYAAHRVSKFPILIRDIEGNSMYLYTNTTCTYRRDGQILPYGSGNISGILVHETFTRYEYEDTDNEETYGQIGTYQLRHVAREDIKFAKDITNSFSALLTEYQYPNIQNGVAYPTYGTNGSMKVSFNNFTGSILNSGTDFSYLGPCGKENPGNTNLYGNGVLTESGQKQNTDPKTNTGGQASGTNNNDGKGFTYSSAWQYNGIWWNNQEDRGEAFIIEVSTKGIQTNQLSLQLVMSIAMGGPRFWKVEWSEDGKWYTTDDVLDPQRQLKDWNYIDSFTLPEIIDWTLSFLHQLPGYKYINVKLPLDMLDKDKVYIRLMVEKNSSGSGKNDIFNYQGTPIELSKACYMSYVAIRYNK